MTGLLALWTVVFLIGCFYISEWLYRAYRVDLFRARLFAIRDELFDLAADGHVAFTNPAYCALRTKINGFVRFGDRVSLPWVLALRISTDRELQAQIEQIDGFAKRWSDGKARLSPKAVSELDVIAWKLDAQVAEQILFATPLLIGAFLFLFASIVALFKVGKNAVRIAKRAFQDWWQPLTDPIAFREGTRA